MNSVVITRLHLLSRDDTLPKGSHQIIRETGRQVSQTYLCESVGVLVIAPEGEVSSGGNKNPSFVTRA